MNLVKSLTFYHHAGSCHRTVILGTDDPVAVSRSVPLLLHKAVSRNAGNGKTTILRALQNLINYLRSDEGYNSNADAYPIRGYMMVSAKELVLLAKAYNNPTRDNTSDVARYKRLRQIEILAIDELGSEPKESIHYGDYVTAAMDMLSFRYEEQFCTLVSSNLTAKEIAEYYDERIADRFREMMLIINFGNEQSFRKQ